MKIGCNRPWDDPEYEEDDWEPDPDRLYDEMIDRQMMEKYERERQSEEEKK